MSADKLAGNFMHNSKHIDKFSTLTPKTAKHLQQLATSFRT